jgi:hypothetical protein
MTGKCGKATDGQWGRAVSRPSEFPAAEKRRAGAMICAGAASGMFWLACICLFLLAFGSIRLDAATARPVEFTQSATTVAVYDFVEITARVAAPGAGNPFTEASLKGEFAQAGSAEPQAVEGFCDSADGSVYRIRFMPSKSGTYTFHLLLKRGAQSEEYSGGFTAADEHRRGPLRVDPAYPWHFIWEGTGEHYFFNGTTAYWLVGFRDQSAIDYTIDRLAALKVNRMRVTISGRESITMFGEPVMNGARWTALISAWPAKSADDPFHPGFDYSRFNVAYWQKFDRMLRHARERKMVISLVLDMGDNGVHPEAGGEDERRYIRYAVARFSAFSNITWDLGDDLDSYRDEAWTHQTGMLIEEWDPYRHLATSHPAKSNDHQDRAAGWFGFTSYQEWSRNQHALMLESRKLQQKTGRIIPQTNEEYGYEDHYPEWAAAGSDSADVLRRTPWEIYMAGAYQTAGESTHRGTNIWPDTGGGWMNGRGDDTQTMFLGYGHIVDFFTGFAWWKTNPHDELVDGGNYCLAEPGKLYAIYLPHAGKVTVHLEPGSYRAEWFDAASGQRIPLAQDATGPLWISPEPPDDSNWRSARDWALLLERH